MSIDSIVKISISANSLQMAQAGFGLPIIIAEHEYLKNRVHTIQNLDELFKLRDLKKEDGLPEQKRFQNHPLYQMASTIFSQNPTISKLKIGKRLSDESIAQALTSIKGDANGDFYGILIIPKDSKDILELSAAIGSERYLAGVDLDETTLEVAQALKDSKGSKKIFAIFKERPTDYPAAAWMGRMLAQAPGSSSWAFKQLEGIQRSKLSTDLLEKLEKATINRHIDINTVGVTMNGKVMSGEYIDIVQGIDWLHVRIQERLFRLLQINEKIPYTLKGIDLVRSEILAQLKEAVYRGLLAEDPEPQVSTPSIGDITPDKRSGRVLPDVSFSARLAGAIHAIEIKGTVTV
jgi:hypothetical protein